MRDGTLIEDFLRSKRFYEPTIAQSVRMWMKRHPAQPRTLKPASFKKVSVYFPAAMLDEIVELSKRTGRPIVWLLREAWEEARERIKKFPGRVELLGPAAQQEPNPDKAPERCEEPESSVA